MILFLRAGQERAVPLPEEAAKSAKATHDLLRRFKELGTNMKAHAPPSAIEQDLQVSSLAGGTPGDATEVVVLDSITRGDRQWIIERLKRLLLCRRC